MTTKLARSLFFATVALAACGSDNKQTPADAPKAIDAAVVHDAPSIDGPLDDAPLVDANLMDASCFATPDPTSHYQIINACTPAQKVYTTHPRPPLLNTDGSLPPLPP